MAKSIPALVTPEVLQWARNLDRITVDEIACRMKVAVAKVEAWEKGEEYPSVVQAKKLAKQYRVPFAYFYLPTIPKKTKRLDKIDYRTFGNWGIGEMSRELRWLLRDIEDRRDAMFSLYESTGITPVPFVQRIPLETTEEMFAIQIRNILSLTHDVQIRLRKSDKALAYCVSKLEERDFLVFQAAQIQTEEMRGLSIAYDVFPIIVLNRKDETSARLFTLIHELVHVMTKTSAICNAMGMEMRNIQDVEMFCNKVAGMVLVPTDQLKKNNNISLIRQYGLDDAYINALARDFAVSREVILHRLWDIGFVSRRAYFERLKKYNDEYKVFKSQKTSGGRIPQAIDKGSQVGRLYTKAVMSAYRAEKLTPREASNHLLGLRIQHFSAIERWCY